MTQKEIQFRDPNFIAYHWSISQITDPHAQEYSLSATYKPTLEERREGFEVLLHSEDDAAQGIAMDSYTYSQTLLRWGIENEFQPYEAELVEVARKQLQKPPVISDCSSPRIHIIGANHASALFVLAHLGTEADCALIEPILRNSQDPTVLDLACDALRTCISGSQTVYPEILQDLRRLIFEMDVNDPEMARVITGAIKSLFDYQVAEAEPILLEALQHENYKISAFAAFALTEWNLPRYCERLQEVAQTWPEEGHYPVYEVRRKIDRYLNPPPPEPVLSEEEKNRLREEQHARDIERSKKEMLARYYPDGYYAYFWKFSRDLFLPSKELGRAYSSAADILTSSDEASCLEKFQQILRSDFTPAQCVAFDIFAFHQTLERHGISNPFSDFSDEILVQARLQLQKEPVNSSQLLETVGANYASAFLALKYLGDSSDLPDIERIVKSSEDINVLFQGWQAIRHCSGQSDILYPELLSNAEKILSNNLVSSEIKRDVLELFHEYKVDGVEEILTRVVQDSYPLVPYIKAEAAWVLLQWNLPKYIGLVRDLIHYYVWQESNLFAVEESYRMIQEYDQKYSAESAKVGSVL